MCEYGGNPLHGAAAVGTDREVACSEPAIAFVVIGSRFGVGAGGEQPVCRSGAASSAREAR